MKKLSEITRPILSLEGFDKKIVERFANLDGKEIHECCCGCCDCCEKTCSDEPYSAIQKSMFNIRYFNEQSIVQKLLVDVKAKDIYDIYDQFNMSVYRATDICEILRNSPLFFNETSCEAIKPSSSAVILTNSRKLKENRAFIIYVKSLCKNYGLTNPIVLSTIDGETMIYFVKDIGTNGEGSIKNSFKLMYDTMDKLENEEEGITHTNCLDVSIDSIDNVYSFVVTVNMDKMYVLNLIR